MADLATMRRDLGAFAAAIGQPLAEWQTAACALDRRTTVIVAPRRRIAARGVRDCPLMARH